MKYCSSVKCMIGVSLVAWLSIQSVYADPSPTEEELVQQCEDYQSMGNAPAHIAASLKGIKCSLWAQNMLKLINN